jgi:hypothetical protein
VEGTDIEVQCARCRLKGKVKYCRFSKLGYNVGVAFNVRRSWNRQVFRPKHRLRFLLRGDAGTSAGGPGVMASGGPARALFTARGVSGMSRR